MDKKPVANGNGRSKSQAGLTASTTIPLGLAAALLVVAFGGIWWASSMSAKVDYLTNDVNGLRVNMNGVQSDLTTIKKTVDRIEWATSSEATKKK